jgi:dUTP pyrophosphatase
MLFIVLTLVVFAVIFKNAFTDIIRFSVLEEIHKPVTLKVMKLSDSATLPVRASDRAAGYDLFAAHSMVVPARGRALVKTDIAITLPQGTYGRVAPRSGLALKKSLDVAAGVIDEDYTGNVGVILVNQSDDDFTVEQGMSVAQLICERILTPTIQEVEEVDETERGAGGFGSTWTAVN